MVASFGAQASAQDLGVKAPPQTEPVVITNATVHTVSGQTLPSAWVYFTDGVIQGVGNGPLPRFAKPPRFVDGSGKHVYPGLFAPYTQMGLTEIASVRASLDMGEIGAATPEVRAVVAMNPDSTLIPVARTGGVLLCGVFPTTNPAGQLVYFDGPGGLIPGRAGVVRMDGWTWEDMAVLDDAGLVVNWPQARAINAAWMDRSEEEQDRENSRGLDAIERAFTDAKAYLAARAADPALPSDIRFEAMRSVFPAPVAGNGSAGNGAGHADSQRPVFIVANDYDQIVSAVSFCAKHSLRCVIVGGRDSLQCADLLKRHDAAVILNGTIRTPKRSDSDYDEAYVLPLKLQQAGVRWCMGSGEETAHERNLPLSAGMAVAYGLDADSALKSISLWPAQILGVGDRVGSIETGKAATLIIADGDILEVASNVGREFIDGREIDLSNKQTKLEEKYREKYRQLGAPKK